MAFEGFTPELFETYAPEKWSSNAHNLPRMRAKDALIQLADQLVQTLGVRYTNLQRGASDEIPNILNQKKVDAQWVYWMRNPEEKKALSVLFEKLRLDGSLLMTTATQDKHAMVGLMLDQESVRVTLRIAGEAQVDRKNLAAKLGKEQYAAPFLELLKELPEGFEIGVHTYTPAEAFFPDSISELSAALAERGGAFAIRRVWPRADALAAGASIVPPLAAGLEALEPLYRFCDWSRENDHTEVGARLQKVEAEKQAKALAFEPGQQVRIVGGMFAGKTGRVEDIDAKAKVKVRVGTMSVMVSGRELTPAG